ncbi:MFS transporter [Streptomyces griseorubiginosus]|uniref:MFS transporter n=1 Tax=Streptomyces griseorubiginosus TaxID=67304 RepID=UPI0036DFF30A
MTVTAVAPTPAPAQAQLIASRRLLSSVFALLGVVMAVWGARMPAVQAAAQLGPGRLAIVLLAAAAGMVVGLQLGGRLAHRHGPARLLAGPAIIFGLSLALLGTCRTLTSLSLAAVVFGMGHGLLDVGANSAAVNLERAYQRRIMSSLHCAYSLGALTGAGLAAVTTWAPYQILFATVGLLTATAAAAAIPMIRSARHLDTPVLQSPTDRVDARQLPRRTVWLLGFLAAACLLGEGAAADWSAVHLRTLHASEAVAAAAYAAYSAAMVVGRLFGDRLNAHFGPTAVARAGAALAAAGLGAGLLIDSAPAALIGWMALGLGLSTTVPSLISAAGRGGPRAVGAVAATGYLGLLTGPAAIGALASLTNLPVALSLPVLLAAVVALSAHRALDRI